MGAFATDIRSSEYREHHKKLHTDQSVAVLFFSVQIQAAKELLKIVSDLYR
jgi:hypothetical protein